MPSAPQSPHGYTFTLDPKQTAPAHSRGTSPLSPGLLLPLEPQPCCLVSVGQDPAFKADSQHRFLNSLQSPWPLTHACPGPSHLSPRWDALPRAVHVGPLACCKCRPLTGALLTTLSKGMTPSYLLCTRISFPARHHMACSATSSFVEGGARGFCTLRMTAVSTAGSERCVD